MSYSMTWLEKILIIDFSNDVTVQEIREHAAEINSDPRFEDIQKIIYNFLKIKSTDINSSDVKIFSLMDTDGSKNVPHAHRAFVSNSNDLKLYVERYKEGLGSGYWNIQLFDTLTEAMSWVPD